MFYIDQRDFISGYFHNYIKEILSLNDKLLNQRVCVCVCVCSWRVEYGGVTDLEIKRK